MEKILIIGAGQAGLQIAASLRAAEFAGAITLVGEETQPPYQRPPLSKAYLQGALEEERLYLRPPEFYRLNAIELRLGARVESLDLRAGIARLQSGEALAFDKLALGAAMAEEVSEATKVGADGRHVAPIRLRARAEWPR